MRAGLTLIFFGGYTEICFLKIEHLNRDFSAVFFYIPRSLGSEKVQKADTGKTGQLLIQYIKGNSMNLAISRRKQLTEVRTTVFPRAVDAMRAANDEKWIGGVHRADYGKNSRGACPGRRRNG